MRGDCNTYTEAVGPRATYDAVSLRVEVLSAVNLNVRDNPFVLGLYTDHFKCTTHTREGRVPGS